VTAPVAWSIVPSVPWSGGSETVKVSPWTSGSPSLPVRVIGRAVSSAVERVWPVAVGASLTAVTVMLTVAVLESSCPSFTLKAKLSDPL
jgi:hypothetical protein